MIGPDGRIDRRTRERVSLRLMEMGDDNLLAQHLVAMELANSAPLIAGNSVQLLVDGPRTYAAMFSAIAAAREKVNIEMFIFGEAQHDGRYLSDLLVEVVGKGIAVNVLYDSLGSADTPPAVFEKLRAAGVRLCEFNPMNPADNRTSQYVQRDHRKIVVVDARVAFAGGINFSSVYSSGSRATLSRHRKATDAIAEGWRDTQVQVEGPVTLELQRLFLESWDKQKCPARQDANYLPEAVSAGSTLLRLNATSTDSLRNETYISALSVLTFARKTVDLTMAYFSPDDQVEEALVNAAQPGRAGQAAVGGSHRLRRHHACRPRALHRVAEGGRSDLRVAKSVVAREDPGGRWHLELGRIGQLGLAEFRRQRRTERRDHR